VQASAVRFYLEYPLQSESDGGAWLDPANIAAFGRAAEAAGVDGIALTDHPAPSRKWLERGGHETLDPFVGLGFLAAATSHIRLMTYLAVVPYRNPLLLAKSMTAVDVLSAGRATFVLGTGYLRSEFTALGVDFEERNALFDEAVEVLRGLWASPHEFDYEGKHFTANGVTLSPTQVQRPHPPLWLGGNAQVVRQRVAAWGDGWAPLTGGGPTMSRTTRTPGIENDQQLAGLIAGIKEEMAAAGRDAGALDVASRGTERLPADAGVAQRLDYIGRLGEIGVTWTLADVEGPSFGAALDRLGVFGEEVIARAR
jgi:probable F420-dependent oxidoreductase